MDVGRIKTGDGLAISEPSEEQIRAAIDGSVIEVEARAVEEEGLNLFNSEDEPSNGPSGQQVLFPANPSAEPASPSPPLPQVESYWERLVECFSPQTIRWLLGGAAALLLLAPTIYVVLFWSPLTDQWKPEVKVQQKQQEQPAQQSLVGKIKGFLPSDLPDRFLKVLDTVPAATGEVEQPTAPSPVVVKQEDVNPLGSTHERDTRRAARIHQRAGH